MFTGAFTRARDVRSRSVFLFAYETKSLSKVECWLGSSRVDARG
jgi:hypothetical protein